MSPLDTGFPRDPEAKKRMLPSVTDVVRELARSVSADPAVLFKAGRSVVAEELAKVKQGFEAAPLDVLVKRARLQLERDGEGTPVAEPEPPPMPVFRARSSPALEKPASPPPAATPAPAKPAPAKPAPAADPFQDLASRSDLNWEKDLPIQPEDAPFRSAILPIPSRSRGPLEISAPIEPVRERGPAPPPLTYAPPPSPPPSSPAIVEPSPPREPRPGFTGDLFEESPTEAPKPLSRPAVASAPSIPLMQPHELVARSRPETPAPVEVLEDNAQPAMEEFHFKAPDPPPPPALRRSGARGWLVAIALVVGVGAGLFWAVREYVFRSEIVKNVPPVARKKPEPAPAATPVPPASPTPAPAVAARPATPPAKPAPAAPKGKAAVLLTPDWTGKPVYVIHFSSTKDRESAAKEALKLGAALGAPARAVEVDLGEKGLWYRVVVGEFPDVEAARAFRAGLEEKKTPGMGFVYEMRGR